MKLLPTLPTLPTLLAVLTLATGAVFAQAPATPEIPSLDVTTGKTGARPNFSQGQKKSDWSDTLITVKGKVHFFRPPAAYEIQIFIMASSEISHDDYIFRVHLEDGSGPETAFEYESPKIIGPVSDWTVLPYAGKVEGGSLKDYRDERAKKARKPGEKPDPMDGYKLTGWVVRIVADGQVLRVAASRTEYETLAKSQAALFDAAVTKSKAPKDDKKKKK